MSSLRAALLAFGLSLAVVVPTPSAWSLPKANRRLLRSEPNPDEPDAPKDSAPSAAVSEATFEDRDSIPKVGTASSNSTTTPKPLTKAAASGIYKSVFGPSHEQNVFGPSHDEQKEEPERPVQRKPRKPENRWKSKATSGVKPFQPPLQQVHSDSGIPTLKAQSTVSNKIQKDDIERPQTHDEAASDNTARNVALVIGSVMMIVGAALIAFFLYERPQARSPTEAQQDKEPSQSLVEGAAPPAGDESAAAGAAEVTGETGAAATEPAAPAEPAAATPAAEPAAAPAGDQAAAAN